MIKNAFIYFIVSVLTVVLTLVVATKIKFNEEKPEITKEQLLNEVIKVHQNKVFDSINKVLESNEGTVVLGSQADLSNLDLNKRRYILLGKNAGSNYNKENMPSFILNDESGKEVFSITKEGNLKMDQEKFKKYFTNVKSVNK